MPVRGVRQVSQALQRIPRAVETRVKEALEDGALMILEDMQAGTPVDADNPGPHARDGLTIRFENDGLTARIGLPGRDLAQDYFWFRFLDGGTQGGEATYRSRKTGKRVTIRVPARPALNIRQNALNGNLDDVERLVTEAINQGLRASR